MGGARRNATHAAAAFFISRSLRTCASEHASMRRQPRASARPAERQRPHPLDLCAEAALLQALRQNRLALDLGKALDVQPVGLVVEQVCAGGTGVTPCGTRRCGAARAARRTLHVVIVQLSIRVL